ncbi:MAG: hypothetical protein LBS27_11870 [Bifidobacteriaceae bacterium]|jgi:hypothetical protein|nr:hypothetical protein [Bifidobacteriaceae bacterium]
MSAGQASGGDLQTRLRNWARGTHRAKAAVELLVSGMRGRLAYEGAPWITELGTDGVRRGYASIDPERLVRESGPLSSGERFTASVVANLLDDETPVALADIARLDFAEARIVLGALRQAAGLPPLQQAHSPAAPSRLTAPAGPSKPVGPVGQSAAGSAPVPPRLGGLEL